jgi:hypothetical protein
MERFNEPTAETQTGDRVHFVLFDDRAAVRAAFGKPKVDDVAMAKKIEPEEERLKTALANAIKNDGATSASTEVRLLQYAGYLRIKNRPGEAVELYKRRFDSEQARGMAPELLAGTCDSLAATLKEAGRNLESSQWKSRGNLIRYEQRLKRDIVDSMEKHGENSAEVERDLFVYAGFLRENKRGQEALPVYTRRLSSQFKRGLTGSAADTADCISRTLDEVGRKTEAQIWQTYADLLRKP